jgi:hypothetical protein
MEVNGIITNNAPDEKQNAPLYSLGFIDRNDNGGQLILNNSKKFINMSDLLLGLTLTNDM